MDAPDPSAAPALQPSSPRRRVRLVAALVAVLACAALVAGLEVLALVGSPALPGLPGPSGTDQTGPLADPSDTVLAGEELAGLLERARPAVVVPGLQAIHPDGSSYISRDRQTGEAVWVPSSPDGTPAGAARDMGQTTPGLHVIAPDSAHASASSGAQVLLVAADGTQRRIDVLGDEFLRPGPDGMLPELGPLAAANLAFTATGEHLVASVPGQVVLHVITTRTGEVRRLPLEDVQGDPLLVAGMWPHYPGGVADAPEAVIANGGPALYVVDVTAMEIRQVAERPCTVATHVRSLSHGLGGPDVRVTEAGAAAREVSWRGHTTAGASAGGRWLVGPLVTDEERQADRGPDEGTRSWLAQDVLTGELVVYAAGEPIATSVYDYSITDDGVVWLPGLP